VRLSELTHRSDSISKLGLVVSSQQPQHFTLILVATMFILLALAEWLDQRRRAKGKS